MKKIKLGDYIELLTDYHSGGSYETMKNNTKILHTPDYGVYVRTLNFERNDFKNDLIYCDKKSYDFLEYSHLKENDVLMNKIANPGSVYIMPKVNYPATCAMNLFLLRFKNINQRYMYYVMKNSEDYIKKQAHGTTTKTITKEEVRNLEFNIHNTKEEQDRVEKFLTDIDKKIENNNAINNNLQQVATTLYDFLFAKKQPNGKLSDILLENEKSTIQVGSSDNICGNYPFFTSGETINEWQDYFVDGINCYLSTGGNASIKVYAGKAAYSTDTWCIYGKENYSSYLYFYLKSIIKSINSSYFAGSGLKHLQKDALLDIDLYIPTKDEIETFNKIANPILIQASQLFIESKKLIKQRDFLLPLLMNGQATIDE